MTLTKNRGGRLHSAISSFHTLFITTDGYGYPHSQKSKVLPEEHLEIADRQEAMRLIPVLEVDRRSLA
jgi:hypothetical protein